MDVALRVRWHIVVDHMRDAFDINSTSRDIGRHQNLNSIFSERQQGSLPCILRLVAVDRGGTDSFSLQSLHHHVGAAFGASENDRLIDLLIAKNIDKRLNLFGSFNIHQLLIDQADAFLLWRNIYADRIDQQTLRQIANFWRHSRREKQRLPIPW